MQIRIENLRKDFGDKTAVAISDFTIEHGEMLGLVGNNGAGKTTLFRLMLDLLKADEGKVTLDEVDPASDESWKNVTGAFIDDAFLIDFLTPEEYFEFIGKVSGLDKPTVYNRLKSYEPLMGGEIMGQKKLIRNLSAGNKQKVGIIAALLHQPNLVILDEPFNFLDPSSQNILKHVLTQYNAQTHATIIISSHNLAHTIDICGRIALLEHGLIIRDLVNNEHSAAHELEDYFNGPTPQDNNEI